MYWIRFSHTDVFVTAQDKCVLFAKLFLEHFAAIINDIFRE